MYSKFEVTVGNYFYGQKINNHLSIGQKMYSECEDNVKNTLSKYILPSGSIDGNMMKEEWFKTKKYDVFLSHSHKDIEKVKAFSGWLNDAFGLTCFIDSCAWGYCDDLLKQIDDMYCRNKYDDTYNYDRRNYSTSHVHMMLSTALTEMMNISECIMFFNTPNSVSMVEDLECIKKGKNKRGKVKISISPWIYHELSMSTFLKRTPPDRLREISTTIFEHSEIRSQEDLRIQYKVSEYLDDMLELNDERLDRWASQCKHGINKHPLDVLYGLYVKV